jgi:hypothetical protein
VLPERAWVTINDGKQIKLHSQRSDWGLDFDLTVSIGAAQVSAVVSSPTEIGDVATLKNVISDSVSTVVDAFGYLEGRGYQTEITSVVMPNGDQSVFSVEIGEIQRAKNERPLGFSDLFSRIVLNQSDELPERAFHRQSLRYALADLRRAILSPTDTLFHCRRAVEGIMQGFKEPQGEGDEKRAWEQMRAALQVEEPPLIGLAKGANPHRHGFHPTITGGQRLSAMGLTWRVVDRFVLFIDGGFKQLPTG